MTMQHANVPVQPPQAEAHRWLEVVSHLDPKYGGLSAAVPALGAAVAAASGQTVSLAAFCVPGEHFVPAEAASLSLKYLPVGRTAFVADRAASESFRGSVKNATAVHIHGLWQHSTAHAARLAREFDRPYMVSAHGMLERWALRQKRWKKSIYAAIVERPLLRRASCLHALTAAEAADYRRFGLRNPVAVIPNGVTIHSEVSCDVFLNQFPLLRGTRVLLFLGRLHPKKGLPLLCDTWADLERQYPDAHLVLAGPDFDNTHAMLAAQCHSLGLQRVTFTGMLSGETKWSALKAAHAFLLPSYSEGLSVSVLEAMGMGVPVIVTRQCNLPDVRTRGCGWEIEPERAALRSAIAECLGASASNLRGMGLHGRELVEARYSWSRVGRQMAAVYEWMAGGAKPSGVFEGESEELMWSAAQKGASA